MAKTMSRLFHAAVLASLLSCADASSNERMQQPVADSDVQVERPSEQVAAAAVEEVIPASSQQTPSPVCGAPESEATWEAADTVAVLLWSVRSLWQAEQQAFRDYQRLDCRECDVAMGLQRYFFESSSQLLERVAERYPEDARALCAVAEARIRAASLGDGSYDPVLLEEARPMLERADTLGAPGVVSDRVTQLLRVLSTNLGR
jgi:hypothetical protein